VCADAEGKYSVQVTWGQVTLYVAASGYARAHHAIRVERGASQEFDVALQPLDKPFEAVEVVGMIQRQETSTGSKSQYEWVEIQSPQLPQPMPLFDESGQSHHQTFAQWIGKQARVRGYYDTGEIGWMRKQQRGIFVEEITLR